MSFDRKPPMDEMNDLPDHLATLAQQLGDDARRLAEMYPAGNPSRWQAQGRSSLGLTHGWTAAAAAVFLVASVGAGVWMAGHRAAAPGTARLQLPQLADERGELAAKAGGPSDQHGAPAADDGSRIAAQEQHRIVEENQAEQRPDPGEGLRWVPAGLFQSLSGPEQEALLDLMEGDALEPASLSI